MTVPMTGTGLLNPIPYVTGFVKHLTLADPSALLLSNDPTVAAITKSSEVPKDKKIDHFVSAAQMSGDRRQYCFFIKYRSTMTLGQIKFENPRMMLWLKEARMWLAPHSHSSLYTTTIGFIHGMHPTYTSRDKMNSNLAPYMEGVEVQLIVENDFYYKNNVRFDTRVVKVQVDAQEADFARNHITQAFFDEEFLTIISNNNPKHKLDFIPKIQKAVMSRETYRAALDSHRKSNEQLISISITGVRMTDSPVKVTYLDKEHTFPEMIDTIKDDKGIPFFTSIEPTKMSESDGRFLLLTTKDRLNQAETKLDEFFTYMHNKGYNTTMAREGESIQRTNYVAPTNFSRAYSGYNTKYTMDPNDNDTRGRRKNAWTNKRAPEIVYDVDFPATIGGKPIKKARQNPRQHQDTATIATLDSDEHTEFESKISSMKTDFTHRLDNIIKQTLETDRATRTLLRNAEAQRDKDNAQLLDAFATSQARTNEAIEAVTKLQVTLVQRENRDKIFQKMILAMYSAMADDNKVPPVTQELMNLFQDDEDTDDETADMETDTTFGDRANQTKRNAEGSTKSTGAAKRN